MLFFKVSALKYIFILRILNAFSYSVTWEYFCMAHSLAASSWSYCHISNHLSNTLEPFKQPGAIKHYSTIYIPTDGPGISNKLSRAHLCVNTINASNVEANIQKQTMKPNIKQTIYEGKMCSRDTKEIEHQTVRWPIYPNWRTKLGSRMYIDHPTNFLSFHSYHNHSDKTVNLNWHYRVIILPDKICYPNIPWSSHAWDF